MHKPSIKWRPFCIVGIGENRIFSDYSLLGQLQRYLDSRCTSDNIYLGVCIDFVEIGLAITALGLLKKKKKKERNLTKRLGGQFWFTTLEAKSRLP